MGALYASSGPFASSSTPQFHGLQFWVHQVNAKGGVFVKAYGKRIPVKLVAYDDQSKTSLAGTLYSQLITRDHVHLLASDFGSVLTSVAVPLAREHKTLLFDVTGTSAGFFTPDNPYVVLTSLPTSGVWPTTLANFVVAQHMRRVAILYSTNDFDGSQAKTLRTKLAAAGIHPVFDQGVPSGTSNYTVLIHQIMASKADSVFEFGYPNNDIAFLQGIMASGMHFPMVFTVFPGQLLKLMEKNVGPEGLAWTYTYPTPPLLVHKNINYGPTAGEFLKEYQQQNHREVNFLTIAGYNAGLIMQKTLETSTSLDPLAMRRAIAGFSGKLRTIDGMFRVNADGAQIGETLPVGQIQPMHGKLGMQIVFPSAVSTAKARYPAPKGL
ncbi:MAG: amino acid ABC transporter substrate-binding protein [Rhodanobacter sp.]|nr:MAG: amino acid ABC transporter substrate-binding protein [Rhodanobacter sp.]